MYHCSCTVTEKCCIRSLLAVENHRVSLISKALSLLAVEALRLVVILGLVGLLVNKVKEASTETANVGTDCVAPQVVVEVMVGEAFSIGSNDGVGGDGGTNRGVKAGAELVRARNHAKESGYDDESGADTLTVSGGVLSLHHQDHAHEEECADDLVDDDGDVHREVALFCTIVQAASHWVGGGKSTNFLIPNVKGAQPGQTDGGEATSELSKHDQDAEQEVAAVVAEGDEHAESDSRVEVATSNVTEDHHGGEEGEGDRHRRCSVDNAPNKECRAKEL
mmetsp:Transcript_36378/g.44427  ORF Transcript_36378/g.44427 Transcript_36378/m.44427 type:complete len:278 (+) Transcript_36378:170-1003(+)